MLCSLYLSRFCVTSFRVPTTKCWKPSNSNRSSQQMHFSSKLYDYSAHCLDKNIQCSANFGNQQDKSQTVKTVGNVENKKNLVKAFKNILKPEDTYLSFLNIVQIKIITALPYNSWIISIYRTKGG